MKPKKQSCNFLKNKELQFCVVLLFLVFSFEIKAQNKILLKSTDTILIEAQRIFSDPLAQLYALNQNTLTRIGANPTPNYSNSFYGIPDVVDVNNPLKILVFYKNQSVIMFLNSDLAPGSEIIKIDNIGIGDISTVGASQFGGFWLFDNTNQQLIGMDMFLNIKIRSQQGIPFVNEPINPHQIVEHSNTVYLVDRNTGIFLFDNYGGFQKFIPQPEVEKIEPIDAHHILFKTGDSLFVYATDFDQQNTIKYSNTNKYDFSITKNILYILSRDTLFIYKIPE